MRLDEQRGEAGPPLRAAFRFALAFAAMAGAAGSAAGQTGSMRVTLPSPAAATLGKFGDIPVSLYSGVPDISGGRALLGRVMTRTAVPAEGAAATGAASAANVANKISHIFREGKNLEGLVHASGGSAEAAYRGVQQAANEALRTGAVRSGANGILPGAGRGAVLNINGVNVQLIGGRVINGEVRLGSFVGVP